MASPALGHGTCPYARRAMLGAARLALVALLAGASGCAARQTYVVRQQAARDLVALFGAAWRGSTGEFRIAGGRIDGSVVRIFLEGPGRRITMVLEHVGARRPLPDGAVLIAPSDSDIVAVLECEPSCVGRGIDPVRSLAEQVLAGHPGRLWEPRSGLLVGRERVAALALALLLCGAALLVLLAMLWRGRRVSLTAWRDAALVAALTMLATVVLGTPSMANWYSYNLRPAGSLLEVDDQNGVVGFFLQAIARQLGWWSDAALFQQNLLLHAVAGGVFYLAFRAMRTERRGALVGALIWALLPTSVRVGWSDSHHVQAEVLFALLLLVWLSAQDERGRFERLLGPLLAAILPLLRLEALVLTPVPLLLGLTVGDRRWWRRVGDIAVYATCVALSAAAVWVLFVERYGVPVPALASVPASIVSRQQVLALFEQFVTINSGMPSWFPWPATLLVVIGVATQLVRRPGQLAAMLAAFCLPQLLLGRLFNLEGMVGVRYFLPLTALLAMMAGVGLVALADMLATRSSYAGHLSLAVGVLAVVVLSIPLYRYRYAFQDEYRFLRRALAALPANAHLLFLPVREDDLIHNDPDCCLDPPHSPLTLAFPELTFEPIPLRPERPRLPAAVGDRSYYYAGALCRLAPTAASEGRNPGLSREVQALCAGLRADPRLELVASAQASSNGFWQFLEPGTVPLELYRIRPDG